MKIVRNKLKKPTGNKSKKRLNISSNESSEVDEIRPPTLNELEDSKKPENNLNIETVRQKKKRKHKQISEVKKANTNLKESEKNEIYLKNWKNNQTLWKFEKLRQISIQNSIFDEEKISEIIWPIAIEYLAGTKGASKAIIIQRAENEINRLDIEAEKKKNIFSSTKYKRAREILQILQ